jgi:hypothetical protein
MRYKKSIVLWIVSFSIVLSYHNSLNAIDKEPLVIVKDDKYGYIDHSGNVIIPLQFDYCKLFSDGLAAVMKGLKWGYINRNGKLIIPFKFDEVGVFSNSLAPAKIGKSSGFINKSGEFSIYLPFEWASGFVAANEDYLTLAPSDVAKFWTEDGEWGYVNTSGRTIWGPVTGYGPDHAPLLDWSEEEKKKSCEGVPEEIRKRIASFPEY